MKVVSVLKYIVLICVIGLVFITVNYVYINSKVVQIAIKPISNINCKEGDVYKKLCSSRDVNWNDLNGTLRFIEGEYDCSDFRLAKLIRILYEYGAVIPKDMSDRIQSVLQNFRFWWDDEGENSMCYWSENHQILFSSAEYLIGNYYPDLMFTKSHLTGKDMAKRAKKRIHDWLQLKWNYGFIEYYSNVYYKEDIAALVNLIDYAEDEKIQCKCKIVLDLLFYDLASQSYQQNTTTTSGRAYQNNRSASNFEFIFKNYISCQPKKNFGPGMLYGLNKSKKYELPPVMSAIANDTATAVIKQSNGLNLKDLEDLNLLGQSDKQLMMQWGMEAFVNPEVVGNTIKALHQKNMFSNSFLTDMRWLDFPLLKNTPLLAGLVKWINPIFVGTAIQKGNTYTYRTPHFSMYTSQAYCPGLPGDQHHVFGVNIDNGISLYHTHPASSSKRRNSSPHWGVGYGRLPHSVQYRNINLSIYSLPSDNCFLEKELLYYTYLYIPFKRIDEYLIEGNYIFCRHKDSYVAFIATNPLKVLKKYDCIEQPGQQMAWISEVSSVKEDGNFETFKKRILANHYSFDPVNNILQYTSGNNQYELVYQGQFKMNKNKVSVVYDGYDSPYIHESRDSGKRSIRCGDHGLFLDFENGLRKFY